MDFFTEEEFQILLENGRNKHEADYDPKPVIKLFTPSAGATWLITDICPDSIELGFARFT